MFVKHVSQLRLSCFVISKLYVQAKEVTHSSSSLSDTSRTKLNHHYFVCLTLKDKTYVKFVTKYIKSRVLFLEATRAEFHGKPFTMQLKSALKQVAIYESVH